VDLKSGGYLIFDQTEALTTVDVNTGGFVGARNFEDTIFKTNLEAAGAIARQLRLRNLGGIIIADFIDMAARRPPAGRAGRTAQAAGA
jgi:ribonuclease G